MSPKELIQKWVRTFNRGDTGALADLYAESAVNHQVPEEPVEGQTAIREMFEQEFDTADMTCIVENIFEDGEWAILEWVTHWGYVAADSSRSKRVKSYSSVATGISSPF